MAAPGDPELDWWNSLSLDFLKEPDVLDPEWNLDRFTYDAESFAQVVAAGRSEGKADRAKPQPEADGQGLGRK